MDAQTKINTRPKILAWISGTIIGIGILFIPLGIIATIGKYLAEEETLFSSLIGLFELITAGTGICGFGVALSRGKRWHLFALLILIFFGSFVVGLFSMVGKETNISYYIWTIGALISLSLISILYIYWEELLDG